MVCLQKGNSHSIGLKQNMINNLKCEPKLSTYTPLMQNDNCKIDWGSLCNSFALENTEEDIYIKLYCSLFFDGEPLNEQYTIYTNCTPTKPIEKFGLTGTGQS